MIGCNIILMYLKLLHLTENDFTEAGWSHFVQMAALVQSQVPTVVFHHPMRFRGQRNELAMNPTKYPTRYDFLMTSSVKLMNFAKKKLTPRL